MSDQTPDMTDYRAALAKLAARFPGTDTSLSDHVFSKALDRLEQLEQENAALRTQNERMSAEAYLHHEWRGQAEGVLQHMVSGGIREGDEWSDWYPSCAYCRRQITGEQCTGEDCPMAEAQAFIRLI